MFDAVRGEHGSDYNENSGEFLCDTEGMYKFSATIQSTGAFSGTVSYSFYPIHCTYNPHLI